MSNKTFLGLQADIEELWLIRFTMVTPTPRKMQLRQWRPNATSPDTMRISPHQDRESLNPN